MATEAGDAYCQALSLNCAGLAAVEHGDPNEGLKLLQVGTVTARDVPPDRGAVVVGEGSRAALQACASADSATALGRLGYPEAPRLADTALAEARELWRPPALTPVATWTVPPRSLSSTGAGSTQRSHSPRRRCAAGRVAPGRPHPVHHPPGHDSRASRAAWRWRRRDLARRARQVAATQACLGRARSAHKVSSARSLRRAHLRAPGDQVAKVIELPPVIMPVLASSV